MSHRPYPKIALCAKTHITFLNLTTIISMSTLAALGASARLSRLVLNRLGVPQLSAGLMTCSDESHALPSSSGRMTASPSTPCAMAPGLSGFAMPWGGDSPNSLVPQLCATPKKKVCHANSHAGQGTFTAHAHMANFTWPFNTPKSPPASDSLNTSPIAAFTPPEREPASVVLA